jgi:hypothetical protein
MTPTHTKLQPNTLATLAAFNASDLLSSSFDHPNLPTNADKWKKES